MKRTIRSIHSSTEAPPPSYMSSTMFRSNKRRRKEVLHQSQPESNAKTMESPDQQEEWLVEGAATCGDDDDDSGVVDRAILKNHRRTTDNKRIKNRLKSKNCHTPPRTKGSRNSSTILKGKIVAVTSRSDTNSSAEASNGTSYNDLVELCQSLGATISNQVHARVDYVITTMSATGTSTRPSSLLDAPIATPFMKTEQINNAITRRRCCNNTSSSATQRVRKAWKLGRPVLPVSWLQDSIQAGYLLEPIVSFQIVAPNAAAVATLPQHHGDADTAVDNDDDDDDNCDRGRVQTKR